MSSSLFCAIISLTSFATSSRYLRCSPPTQSVSSPRRGDINDRQWSALIIFPSSRKLSMSMHEHLWDERAPKRHSSAFWALTCEVISLCVRVPAKVRRHFLAIL
jgi:hypothetical protein